MLCKLFGRWSCLSLLLVAGGLCLTGCSSLDPNPPNRFVFEEERDNEGVFPGSSGAGRYSSILRPGDLLIIGFSDVDKPPPPLTLNVPESGVITLPFNVHVQATGKTTPALEKDIRDSYVPTIYVNLTVSVKIERRAFFVDGEVKAPGRQEYIGEITTLRALSTAGGFTDFANRKKIEVRRTGGHRFVINWYDALKDQNKDLPIYPGDHIIVMRKVGPW
jgi:protein involved in polysaccharide export with SLBB domain